MIFIAFISLSAFSVNAHQYFFAFAEVEYNQMQECLEGTLILSAHDLEECLIEKGSLNTKFDKLTHDSLSIAILGQELFSDFKFNYQGKVIKLAAQDFFLTKNGLIEFYFRSEKIKLEKEFELEFSNLMDEFPQQQNKITFIYNGNKQTASFLNDKRKQKLTIE
ncbi:MAG: DUF6702 family protein [Flavobacteriia bacterium]